MPVPYVLAHYYSEKSPLAVLVDVVYEEGLGGVLCALCAAIDCYRDTALLPELGEPVRSRRA
jgi:hypothetical protein